MQETALIRHRSGAAAVAISQEHAGIVLEYMEQSLAKSTRRAYKSVWGGFAAWCEAHGYWALPADSETVAAYLAERAAQGTALNTVRVTVSAIGKAHAAAGQRSPLDDAGVRQTLQGISRSAAPPQQVAGIRWEQADAAAALCANGGGSLKRLRDAAIVALMSDGMLRVSELCALDVQDLEAEGPSTITIRRSKTDQTGKGAVLPVRQTTVRRVRRWLDAASLQDGPLFRGLRRGGRPKPVRISDDSVREAVKARVAQAVDAGEVEPPGRVSTHSFRVGSAQSFAQAGASLVEMQLAGRWQSPDMPARYARGVMAAKGGALRKYRGN